MSFSELRLFAAFLFAVVFTFQDARKTRVKINMIALFAVIALALDVFDNQVGFFMFALNFFPSLVMMVFGEWVEGKGWAGAGDFYFLAIVSMLFPFPLFAFDLPTLFWGAWSLPFAYGIVAMTAGMLLFGVVLNRISTGAWPRKFEELPLGAFLFSAFLITLRVARYGGT